MEDNPYFKLVPSEPFVPSPLEPNELFRGQAWSVYLQNERYELNYLTGHLVGTQKRLPITQEEAECLITREVDVNQVLLAYGAD